MLKFPGAPVGVGGSLGGEGVRGGGPGVDAFLEDPGDDPVGTLLKTSMPLRRGMGFLSPPCQSGNTAEEVLI